ncbi:hypothetical protein BGY98DRAFT_972715, partial [Russula aff. rugulosa BPL654]
FSLCPRPFVALLPPGRLPTPTASWPSRRPIAATCSSVHMCPHPRGCVYAGFPMNRFAPSD